MLMTIINGTYDHSIEKQQGIQGKLGEVKFLDKEVNWKGRIRKIKKEIYINSLDLTKMIDTSKLMNLEKGFDFNQ